MTRPEAEDDDDLLAELRATDDRPEPDWHALQARIGAAIDREPSPLRARRRRWAAVGVAALAAAALVVLLAVPRGAGSTAGGTDGAVALPAPAEPPLTDDDVAEALALPDDLGGITIDEALVDEAVALYDDEDI